MCCPVPAWTGRVHTHPILVSMTTSLSSGVKVKSSSQEGGTLQGAFTAFFFQGKKRGDGDCRHRLTLLCQCQTSPAEPGRFFFPGGHKQQRTQMFDPTWSKRSRSFSPRPCGLLITRGIDPPQTGPRVSHSAGICQGREKISNIGDNSAQWVKREECFHS